MADDTKGETASKAAAIPAPVMDVVPPPPASPPAEDKPHDAPPPDANAPQTPTETPPATKSKPITPKAPSTGVGMAIVATVVIVLGLAAIAVYAFLKSKQ